MRLLQKARLQTKINPRISDIAGKNQEQIIKQ